MNKNVAPRYRNYSLYGTKIQLYLRKPFGNLYRKQHVLFVCREEHDMIILGHKSVHPDFINRLPGGGVDKGETTIEAGCRELLEVLSINRVPDELHKLVEIHINVSTIDSGDFHLTTTVFLVSVLRDEVRPSSDHTNITHVSLAGLKNLADQLNSISPESEFVYEGKFLHYWSDYGKVYDEINRIVWEALCNKIVGVNEK